MKKLLPLVFLLASSCQWIQPFFFHQERCCVASSTQEPQAPQESLVGSTTQVVRCESRYDAYVTEAMVRTPQRGDGDAVILLLGELPAPLEDIPWGTNDWLVHIPSRPNLSYQLVAEGDLWGTLDYITATYPLLGNKPWYLVGFKDAADAALVIANEYRYRFRGVAVNGGKMGWNVPNLDHFPVVFFEEDATDSLWGGRHLIETLQARGNQQAIHVAGGCEEAIVALSALEPDLGAVYTFDDYRYSVTNPWLQVLAKHTEKEPARIAVLRHDDTLIINAPNVLSARITKDKNTFPNNVSRITFNGETYTFAEALGVMTLGEEQLSLPSKADIPSGLLNFFRSEPLYVVYQDAGAPQDFVVQARTVAESFAALQFEGVPRGDVKIPILPLSQYDPDTLPPHRIIAVGMQDPLQHLLTSREGYLPVRNDKDGVFVNGKPHEMPFYRYGGIACGLTYPPERPSNLRLALLLMASDDKALQALSQQYLSATALYRTADLRLWVEHQGTYYFAGETTFDGWWGCNDAPSVSLDVPVLTRETWNATLCDILGDTTHGAAVPATLFYSPLPPPTRLTPATLKKYVGDTHFVVAEDRATKTKRLISVADWEALSPEERAHHTAHLFPYSTYEVVMGDFRRDMPSFGRKLLRARS